MSPEENAGNNPSNAASRESPTAANALSFAGVADTYDRARPSYPVESVAWLVGTEQARVLEVGAGTGKLTELLVAAGHDVLATDPLPEMLALLSERVPGARTAVASAERLPAASGTVDVVVCAQSFHWFNHPVALDEIARVLRPGGVLALVWNTRDEGIPWVRKLGAIIGGRDTSLTAPLVESPMFGEVEEQEFRFWQNLRRDDLLDLVRSRSYTVVMPEHQRAEVLARVGALYDDYGRGHDGMKLPYLTKCYRAVVTDHPPMHPAYDEPEPDDDLDLSPSSEPTAAGGTEDGTASAAPAIDPDATQPVPRPDGPEDTGTILINFS